MLYKWVGNKLRPITLKEFKREANNLRPGQQPPNYLTYSFVSEDQSLILIVVNFSKGHRQDILREAQKIAPDIKECNAEGKTIIDHTHIELRFSLLSLALRGIKDQ